MRGYLRIATFLGSVCLFATAVFAGPAEMERARHLYARTQYEQALEVLRPASNDATPGVQELIGKSYFMLGDYKKAIEALERAAAADPKSSVIQHWLGRTWGRRAETANPLMAPAYASKTRQAFEKSVELDGRNLEAMNDLFSYYVEAPGFLGGGLDKAAALAKRIQTVDPIEGHYALAQIAEKRREWGSAEEHFRNAMEMAPHQVGRVVDLARFLSKRGRDQESEVLFAKAESIAPNQPRIMFERASAYIRANKNLSTAKLLLQKYLQAPLTPDDPPRAEAQRLLKQTLAAGA